MIAIQQPHLWILVGGNGAGKSTFFELFLKPYGVPFVNADLIAREHFPDDPETNSYKAASLAETLRSQLLQKGESFCFETVFSHPTKLDFIAKAKTLGYKITLVAIHLSNSSLNKARVSQRVVDGGHNVPEGKIESRIPRTLDNIRKAVPLCDEVRILDNSSLSNPYRPIITIKNSNVDLHIDPIPDWAQNLVP